MKHLHGADCHHRGRHPPNFGSVPIFRHQHQTLIIVTQSTIMSRKEPNDRNLHEKLRQLDRRVSRLEDTQINHRELDESFVLICDRIGGVKTKMDQRFDSFEATMTQCFEGLNAKFDLAILYLERRGNT